jgi:hypothetical protein
MGDRLGIGPKSNTDERLDSEFDSDNDPSNCSQILMARRKYDDVGESENHNNNN